MGTQVAAKDSVCEYILMNDKCIWEGVLLL